MYITTKGKIIDLSYPRVMGILNVTPDSFSDGGKYQDISSAIDRVALMISEGADIIDVGGESTRPGSQEIGDEEELNRVIPIISELISRFDIFISINTSKASVIKYAVDAGVHLINDIRSLKDPESLIAAANSGLPICLMHMQGQPSTMQKHPHYKDIILEIKKYFKEQISRCEKFSINKNRLLLDPGFGFGKTLDHNYCLISKLWEFRCFNLPLLIGVSRKSMISKLLNLSPDKCISGNISCAVIAALQGANIIRVHDVRQTVEAMHIVKTVLSSRKNIFFK